VVILSCAARQPGASPDLVPDHRPFGALSTVAVAGAKGIVDDKPLPFFLERYAEAYRLELDHFVDALTRGTPPQPSGSDGVKALALAEAALRSLQTGRTIAL
jgi:myo-inositol 2-dehydrogenase / D-chiro-inositol 1-dehydrogenase